MIERCETGGLLLLAATFTIAFAKITYEVMSKSALTRLDERVMAAIARSRTPRRDAVVAPLGMMATREPLAIQSFLAFAIIGVTLGDVAALWFAIAAAGSGVLAEGAKRLVRRPRPVGTHVIPWVSGTAYPSGDLLTGAAIYLTAALIAAPHLPSFLASVTVFGAVAALVVLLGVCRVLAGVHHPSDVVGGACAGLAWALLVAQSFS